MTEHPVGEADLQAYIDGRLTEARRASVEAYLAAHAEVKDRVAADRGYRESLRIELAEKSAEPIPERLRIANLSVRRRPAWTERLRPIAAGLALFAVGLGSGWLAGRNAPSPARPAPASTVAQDAASAYRTFVVEVTHPVEVDASRETHLVTWLSKRLGRKLAAPDLAPFGYRLMGGRLLSCDRGAAAQLMYEDGGGKRLTVYVRAMQGNETAFRFQQQGDTVTLSWIDGGFGFAVTAPVQRDELQPIAEAVYQGLDAGAPAGTRPG